MNIPAPWDRYLRALGRFWYVLIVGIPLALLAGAEMAYHVKLGLPPKLNPRTSPNYTASTLLLLDGADHPLERIALVVTHTTKATKGATHGSSAPTSAQTSTTVEQPDIGGLVVAANELVNKITGDAVVALRNRTYGIQPGQVTASALYASKGLRYRPGPLPIIQVTAVSGTSAGAVKLSYTMALAFTHYLPGYEVQTGVPKAQRYTVEVLERPQTALSSGGPKKTLPALVAMVALAFVVILCIVLDTLKPRGPRTVKSLPSPPDPDPSPSAPPVRTRVIEPDLRPDEPLLKNGSGATLIEPVEVATDE